MTRRGRWCTPGATPTGGRGWVWRRLQAEACPLPSPHTHPPRPCPRNSESSGKKEKQKIPLKCDKQPPRCTLGVPGTCGRDQGQGGFQGLGHTLRIRTCPEISHQSSHLNFNQEAGAEGRSARTAGATHCSTSHSEGEGCWQVPAQGQNTGQHHGQRPGGWWEQRDLLPAAPGHGSWLTGPQGPCVQPSRRHQPHCSPETRGTRRVGTGLQSPHSSREWCVPVSPALLGLRECRPQA